MNFKSTVLVSYRSLALLELIKPCSLARLDIMGAPLLGVWSSGQGCLIQGLDFSLLRDDLCVCDTLLACGWLCWGPLLCPPPTYLDVAFKMYR